MLSVSYAGKNAYSAGKTSGVGVVPLELIGAMCSPTVPPPLQIQNNHALTLRLTPTKTEMCVV